MAQTKNKRVKGRVPNRTKRTRQKKNVKKNDGFYFPAQLAVMLLLIAVLGVGFLLADNLCENTGNMIKKLEVQKEELTKDLAQQEKLWAECESEKQLRRAMREHRIVMAYPRDTQVIEVKALDWIPLRETKGQESYEEISRLPEEQE